MLFSGSQSQNGGQNRLLAGLTLTVVVELLNAALAASTVRVILPSVLFLRATILNFHIYNSETLLLYIYKKVNT